MVANKSSQKEHGHLLQSYAEALRLGTAVLPDGKPIKKLEALMQVWSLSFKGDGEKEEIFKAGIGTLLQALLDRGDLEERHLCMGALAALAQSEKYVMEAVTPRVIATATGVLLSDHDRGKLPAVQLLSAAALRPELCSRVADSAFLPIVDLVKSEGKPGWGAMLRTQSCAVVALRTLIENVEGELPEMRVARRRAAVSLGVVPCLMRLVAAAPPMPEPPMVPAPLPPVTKKSASSKGRKGGRSGESVPLGIKNSAAIAAASCMRFLSLVPEFVPEFLGTGLLPDFVKALTTANDELAAYLAGTLWEVSAERDVAEEVAAADAVRPLLHIISVNMTAARAKKKKKKVLKEGKDGKDGKGGKNNGNSASASSSSSSAAKKAADAAAPVSEPPCFPDLAVCNAAGALHHLTFLDEPKLEVVRLGGLDILAACLSLSNPQTYENAAGALWNCGLDARNALRASATVALPSFLTDPVPDTWRTIGDEALPRDMAAAAAAAGFGGFPGFNTIGSMDLGGGPDGTFLTR